MYNYNSSSDKILTLSTAYNLTVSSANGASNNGSASSGGNGVHNLIILCASRTYSGSSHSIAIRNIYKAYGNVL